MGLAGADWIRQQVYLCVGIFLAQRTLDEVSVKYFCRKQATREAKTQLAVITSRIPGVWLL